MPDKGASLMETQCTASQLEFHALGRREVVGRFDGGNITSDAGGLLLRETEKRTGIVHGFAQCFEDSRDQFLIYFPCFVNIRHVRILCNDHPVPALHPVHI